MKIILSLIIVLLAVSCGPRRPGKLGAPGINGTSMGVDILDIAPGDVCFSGGLSVSTFNDTNSDGVLDLNETVVKIKTICNGVDGNAGADGEDGQSATISIEAVAAGSACPSGGAEFSSNTSSSSVVVCNGTNGQNGLNGLDGLPGEDGADGTSILPVKFCNGDNSTYPEYGLMLGEDLYAVYWGTTPGSPNKSQAFLTKLVPGNYQSTGGNNCQFVITSNND